MHQLDAISGLSPFEVVGELAALARQGRSSVDFELSEALLWTKDGVAARRDLIRDLAQRILQMGQPDQHPWRGVGPVELLPLDVDRLLQRIRGLRDQLQRIVEDGGVLARPLRLEALERLVDLDAIHLLALRLAGIPTLSRAALSSHHWSGNNNAVDELLAISARHAVLRQQLAICMYSVTDNVMEVPDVEVLRTLPPSLSDASFRTLHTVRSLLVGMQERVEQLRTALGLSTHQGVALPELRSLLNVAEGVTAAPDASPDALAATAWLHGLEHASDLAAAAVALQKTREAVGDRLTSSAWDLDLQESRRVLASHGTGVLRLLSGKWRRHDRLVRSFLKDQKADLADVLEVLDQHAAGRTAQAVLKEGAEFGKQAFGRDWRGDRSSAPALFAMVSWVRGLGAVRDEVRMLAARTTDRQHIGRLYAALKEPAEQLGLALARLEPGILLRMPALQTYSRQRNALRQPKPRRRPRSPDFQRIWVRGSIASNSFRTCSVVRPRSTMEAYLVCHCLVVLGRTSVRLADAMDSCHLVTCKP